MKIILNVPDRIKKVVEDSSGGTIEAFLNAQLVKPLLEAYNENRLPKIQEEAKAKLQREVELLQTEITLEVK